MGKYRIFLASSADLRDDRREFEIFIRRKNDELEARGISLELRIWEDSLEAMAKEGSQEEYNRIIREECDIFVMLFSTKVGMYTKEEFDVAYEHFTRTGKPKIFTYFKDAVVSMGSIEESDVQSLLAFKRTLKDLKHFQPVYKNTEGLLLSFGAQLEKLIAEDFPYPHNVSQDADKFTKDLTVSIPKIDPDSIIGRENDLERLHKLLSEGKRVVVNGLGGLGKTTLARAYLGKYYEQYRRIVWITQNSENIEDDFANAAGLIENLGIDVTDVKGEQLFIEIIRILKNVDSKPNLLVIDNAEQSLQKYRAMLPGQPNWHVLITSREELEGFEIHELAFLNEQEAITLFRKHYKHKQISDIALKELVESVGYHTLTIEILAKTAQIQRYDIATLKKGVEEDLRSRIRVPHSRMDTIEGIGSYLRSVFNLSGLNEEEIWVMKQFVCLPGEFQSYDRLRKLVIDEQGSHAVQFSEVLTGLAQKGWLLYDREIDAYKMHRIIKEVTRKEKPVSIQDVDTLCTAIIGELLTEAGDNPVDKFAWVPYGKAILINFEEEMLESIDILQNNLGMVLKDLGDYTGAKVLLEKTLKSDEKIFGIEHPTTAISYSNLALVLKDLGDYEGARVLLEKAVKSDEKNFGVEHPSTALRYSNLAIVLRYLGDYEGARVLQEKAVKSDEKNFGAGDPSTARGYSNLALVLQDLGDYEGARMLLDKTVRLTEMNYGVDHPITAISYSNLAMVLLDLGDYKEARELMHKAVKSDEKNFGVEHPSTARSYSNLAMTLQVLGEYREALNFSKKAVDIFRKILPANHPDIKISEMNYETMKSSMENPLPDSET